MEMFGSSPSQRLKGRFRVMDRFSIPFDHIARSGGAEALEIDVLPHDPPDPDFDAMSDWDLMRRNQVRLTIEWPEDDS